MKKVSPNLDTKGVLTLLRKPYQTQKTRDKLHASVINTVLSHATSEESVLVLTDVGHMPLGFGLQHLVWEKNENIKEETLVFCTREN